MKGIKGRKDSRKTATGSGGTDGQAARRASALALARRHEPAIESWLRRKGVSPEDRRDILQEVGVAATKSPDALLAADAPEAWLRRVAHRRFVDLVKGLVKRGAEQPVDDIEIARRSRSVSSKVALKRVFERCSAELPNEQSRQILVLWHEQGLQPEEMARVLNERGVTNSAGGRFTATIVQQRLRREIVPRLKRLLEEPRRI